MHNEVYILVYLVTFLCFNYVSVLCISVSDENKKNTKKTKTNGWNNAISKQYTNNTYFLCGSRCKAVLNWMHLYF